MAIFKRRYIFQTIILRSMLVFGGVSRYYSGRFFKFSHWVGHKEEPTTLDDERQFLHQRFASRPGVFCRFFFGKKVGYLDFVCFSYGIYINSPVLLGWNVTRVFEHWSNGLILGWLGERMVKSNKPRLCVCLFLQFFFLKQQVDHVCVWQKTTECVRADPPNIPFIGIWILAA